MTLLAATCSAIFVNTPTYLVSTCSFTFAVHHGSSGSVKSLVDLEHFDLEEDLLWSDSVATIGQPRTHPQVGHADWPGKPSQRKFPSLFAIAVFVHFASHYCILRKMSRRYGKAKRQFGTKREKGDDEADTSADAPVAGQCWPSSA